MERMCSALGPPLRRVARRSAATPAPTLIHTTRRLPHRALILWYRVAVPIRVHRMTNHQTPSRGAIGGAANEAGAEYRRGVAAYFVAHGLYGIPVEGLPFTGEDAIVEAVALETDFPVDDVLVSLRRGRLFIQAKRDLTWRLIPDIADQWIGAVREPQFDETMDVLLAVAGSLSESVSAASLALRRARDGTTSYTQAETDAITRLREVLSGHGASLSEVDKILQRAAILQLTVEDPGQTEATRGRLLLDGHVVSQGEGARAWRELLSIAGDAARFRVGHSMEVWLQHLRERGVPLVADVRASRASYLTARQEAVARYRDSLTRRGAMVDLNPLGIAVPPIAFDEMDAGVAFYRSGNNRDSLDPLWTFRRHGRIVVTGLPGGGKSTAIANIAGEWASHTDWSLPILVSLRRIAEKERFRDGPLRDRIVEMAAESVDPLDRPLVIDALHEALRVGHAVLFFDGLDEAADRSLLLVADIAELLNIVHPDTDVLVTARDVAYADTQQLGFVDFRVGHPQNVAVLVAAVLKAIATVRRVDDADVWISTREEWVEHALGADAALRETPLFPVLLASLAAESTADTLPRTRTLILEQVVQDVVKRRETTRELLIPSIHESQHAAVLLGSYPLIAVTLLNEGGSAPRARLTERVAPYLQGDWGLPAGVAAASAEQVLLFWDEAGVFVASGGEKIVAPRLQLLLEIGVALHAAAMPEAEAVSWVQEVLRRPEAREAVVLAAGKSGVIADAFIDAACELDDDALVTAAARAISHGGVATEAAHRRLLDKLNHYIAAGDDEGWRAFRLVMELTVPVEAQESILQTIDLHYPAPYPAIARAYACLKWAWQPDRLQEFLEAVLLQERPALPNRRDNQGFDIRTAGMTDDIAMRILESAATTLLPNRPDLAPAAAKAMGRASMRTADVIATALRRNGHGELVDTERADWTVLNRQFLAGAEDTRQQIDRFLAMLRSFAPAAQLSLSQQRRLAEFGSFMQTLDLNSPDSWPRTANTAATWPQFVEAVMTLGGFDGRVLAAQATILEKERDSDSSGMNRAFWSLIDLYPAAPLVHWSRLSDPSVTRDLMLKVLRIGGRAARLVAAKALIHNPDKAATATAIRMLIDDGPPSSALPAVWAYLRLIADVDAAVAELAGSQRASVRESVARVVPPVHNGNVVPFANTLARDPVRQVRLAVLQRLEQSTDDLRTARPLLEEVSVSLDPDFTCHYCGKLNPASADSCPSCHIVVEKPSNVAIRLLKKLNSADGPE